MKTISIMTLLSAFSLVIPTEVFASLQANVPQGYLYSEDTFTPTGISQSQLCESKPRVALLAERPAFTFSQLVRLAKVRFITDNDSRLDFDKQDFSTEGLCHSAGYVYKNCPEGYVTGSSCPYDSTYVKECVIPDSWCLSHGYQSGNCKAPSYPTQPCPYNPNFFRSCENDYKRACEELSYTANCDSGTIADPAAVCPYDSSYHGCVCNPCHGYDYTAEEATAQGWHPSQDVCNSCGTIRYKRQADSCDGYLDCDNGPETGAGFCWSGTVKKYAACKSCSCEDEGYYRNQTQCGLGYVLSESEVCPCDASYKKCVTSCRIQALNSGNYAEDANGVLYSVKSPNTAFIEYSTDDIPAKNSNGQYYEYIKGAIAIDQPACRSLTTPVLTASAVKNASSLSHRFSDIDLVIVGDGKYTINKYASLGANNNKVTILMPFDLDVNANMSFYGDKKLNKVTINSNSVYFEDNADIKELNVLDGMSLRQWTSGRVTVETFNLSGTAEINRDGFKNQYWTVKNLNITGNGKLIMKDNYYAYLKAEKLTMRDQSYMIVSENSSIGKADLYGHSTMYFDFGNYSGTNKATLGSVNMYPDDKGKPCLLWTEGTLNYKGADYQSSQCGGKDYWGHLQTIFIADKNQAPVTFDLSETCPMSETYNVLNGYAKFTDYCFENKN